jgi:hypothetical protein
MSTINLTLKELGSNTCLRNETPATARLPMKLTRYYCHLIFISSIKMAHPLIFGKDIEAVFA